MKRLLVSVLFFSILANALPAAESQTQAGVNHPLARETGAETWSPGKAEVPNGLIWRAQGRQRGVALCVHGVQTHSAWFGPLARELSASGWTVIAPDRRGSGLYNQQKATGLAYTRNARQLLADLGEQMTAAREEAGGQPLVLIGTSWGANLAGGYLHQADPPEPPDGLVLLVPGLRTDYDPPAYERILLAAFSVVPGKRIKLKFGPDDYRPRGQPTASPGILDDAIRADEQAKPSLLLAKPTARTLRAGLKLNSSWSDETFTIDIPTLLIQADRDQIMRNCQSRKLAEARCSDLTMPVILDAGHGAQLTHPWEIASEIPEWSGKKLKR